VASESTSGTSPSTILLGQAFGDGGLADAWIAHEQRVVLLNGGRALDGALDLGLAADQRIDLAVAAFSLRLTQ
jgi:hypothetical protein